MVSNLSLIMGVTGANVSNKFILVAGVAGLLAGAFSMGGGEYVSMRVQRELFERLLHIEAHELATEPEEEHEELREIYEQRGFPPDLAQRVTEVVMADPRVALDTHAREELGLDPEELGSPWGAAISSCSRPSQQAARSCSRWEPRCPSSPAGRRGSQEAGCW